MRCKVLMGLGKPKVFGSRRSLRTAAEDAGEQQGEREIFEKLGVLLRIPNNHTKSTNGSSRLRQHVVEPSMPVEADRMGLFISSENVTSKQK